MNERFEVVLAAFVRQPEAMEECTETRGPAMTDVVVMRTK